MYSIDIMADTLMLRGHPAFNSYLIKTMDTKPSEGCSLTLKKILVPVDFSEFSLKAAHYAVCFAGQFDATIELFYALEQPSFISGTDGIVITLPEGELVRHAQEKLRAIANTELRAPGAVKIEVRVGRPYEEIVKYAKEMQIDLIIIATHGYTGLKHVFLGSTTERVVRHAPCPVLVVREKEHEFIRE
jgi:nucleotide-binding universal stress UspA family protein